MDKRKCGKIFRGVKKLGKQGWNSRGNVDRNQEEDKRGNTKEESKDKEMEHSRKGMVRQGVEREVKGDKKENDKI